MTPMTQQNTKPVILRSRAWFLTWNNYPNDWVEIITNNCKEYVAQPEIGESGNKHIQGVVKFDNARSFESVKKLFPGAHLEKCKNFHAAKAYCSKEKTKNGETISNERKLKDKLAENEPNKFQKFVIELIKKEPNDRDIYWFCDENGNAGKTTLARHLCIKNKNCLYLSGKGADMKYVVATWLKKNKPNDIEVIFIDYTRTIENYISYTGIEELKNGIFCSTKYECEMCIYNPPHIIILANFLPNHKALSLDRWRIYDLKNDELSLLDIDTDL